MHFTQDTRNCATDDDASAAEPHQRSSLCIMHNTTTLRPFNGLCSRTAWVSQYQEGKTSRDLNEARDDCFLGCSGISWTICKQFAPRFRQITTPTPHHSVFTGRMLFLPPSQQCQSRIQCTVYSRHLFWRGDNFSPKKLTTPPPNGCQIVCYKSLFFDQDSELRIYHRNFLLTGNKLEITRH